MTFFPYKYILINEFGLIIGSNKFPCFPIIQYSCLFFIGFYFSKNNIKYNNIVFVISCITLIIFLINITLNHGIPTRFPPTIYWIIGSWFPLYVYYLISIKLNRTFNNIKFFQQNWRKHAVFFINK